MKSFNIFGIAAALLSSLVALPSFSQTAALNVGGIPTATCAYSSLTITGGNLTVTCDTSVNYTGGTPPTGPFALTLTSNPTGGTFTCNGLACVSTYALGATVTVVATPATGGTFTSWSGCTGANASVSGTAANTCNVTMNAPVALTANFSGASAPPPPPGVVMLATPPTCGTNAGYAGSAGSTYAFPIPHTSSGAGQFALTLYPFSASNFQIESSISKVAGDWATAKTMSLVKTTFVAGTVFPYYKVQGTESAGLGWIAADAGRGIAVVPAAEQWYFNLRFIPTTTYQGPWTVSVQVSSPNCN